MAKKKNEVVETVEAEDVGITTVDAEDVAPPLEGEEILAEQEAPVEEAEIQETSETEATVEEEEVEIETEVAPKVEEVKVEEAVNPISMEEKAKMKFEENKLVYLDGNPVTLRYIKEQQATRKDIRIVEVSPDVYKTLQRMQG